MKEGEVKSAVKSACLSAAGITMSKACRSLDEQGFQIAGWLADPIRLQLRHSLRRCSIPHLVHELGTRPFMFLSMSSVSEHPHVIWPSLRCSWALSGVPGRLLPGPGL